MEIGDREMNGSGVISLVAICCVAIPLLIVASVAGPVGLLVIGGIAAAIYANRGGNLGDLPDVIRQGFSKRD
jgi:hypothetical protein